MSKVAKTIIKQLGGKGKLKAMINARGFEALSKIDWASGAGVKFRFSGSRKANRVKIRLDKYDLYNVQFFQKYSALDDRNVEEFLHVHAENLVRVFEDFTGLYLSL